ncbi:DUF6264 family protein [Leucobacter triazinivorans]|uniref:Uncharacterized protein n=1 Tax=Leucobacter triazinivorans TaxID=1784719 RepID=A0A4P6KDS8_9MICO|nr:DUF6264 family protein [Leucobacter triazinivorans]QBE48333.1 hypothetical protein EVS81_05345 [Leucobacter triazinivorans]
MSERPEPEQQPEQPGQPGQQPPARPAPAYGELAPEGWEWKPPADPASDAPAGVSAAAATGSPSPGSSPIAGVPHNLGAGGSAAAPNSTPASVPAAAQRGAGEPAPYRAAEPQPAPAPAPAPQPGAPKPRLADRVITIILLVIGAFGALNSAASFFSLESQLRLTANMIGIESPEVAPWVGTLGLVSGLAMLLLYAVTLIFSIQRMRARKIAFWVPLAAGAAAVIIALIIPMIAMGGAPEIMQQIENDPSGSIDRMMQYLQDPQ